MGTQRDANESGEPVDERTNERMDDRGLPPLSQQRSPTELRMPLSPLQPFLAPGNSVSRFDCLYNSLILMALICSHSEYIALAVALICSRCSLVEDLIREGILPEGESGKLLQASRESVHDQRSVSAFMTLLSDRLQAHEENGLTGIAF